MARFPFTDLHSFKDYVGFVKLCAPADFPKREGVSADEQWSLDLAFEGLRTGLRISGEEPRNREVLSTGRALIDDAYSSYRAGRLRDGFFKLEELQRILRMIPSK